MAAYNEAPQKKKKEKLTAKRVKERFLCLQQERVTWEDHWQEVADYILPNRNDITVQTTNGLKRNLQILDNTAIQSNELLAGALHGLLTSPNSLWFELTTGLPEIDQLDEVRQWLQKHTQLMHNVMNNANFQTEVHQYYLDLTALSTAGMTIEEDDESIVRFGTRHIRELFVAENNKGRIDEVYRSFRWNVRQIVAEFGEEVLAKSKDLQEAWDKQNDLKFEIIHAVYPRDIAGKNFRDPRRFISQYVLCSSDGEKELYDSHYREFPYVVARWTKAAGEVYGRGPGMTALPDAKTLNKMTETILIGAQKAVDPPMQVPDDGFILPLMTRPGGLNYYRSGSTDRIEPIYRQGTNIDFGFEALKERRQRIRESFYIDQLQLNQGPQMTATEVNQRTEERMRLLGPMLGRQQVEFLRPLIDRVYEIMDRRGMIDAAPQVLVEKKLDLDVTYSSMIAKAQRSNEGQNIARTMQAVSPFVSADPAVLDNFDGDQAVRTIAKIYGLPQELIRDIENRDGIRKSRQDAQEAQLKMQEEKEQVESVSKAIPGMMAMDKAQQEQGAV